jgi:hypothetical protein
MSSEGLSPINIKYKAFFLPISRGREGRRLHSGARKGGGALPFERAQPGAPSWRRRVWVKCGASRGLGARSCQLATEPPCPQLPQRPSRSVGTRCWAAACGEQRTGTMRASTARLPTTSLRQTPTGWAPWPCAGAQVPVQRR